MKRIHSGAARHLGTEASPALRSTPGTRSVGGRRARLLAAALLAAGILGASAVHAEVYVVDGSHPQCSNDGPGTAGQPYCTISAAVNARREPGTTITVVPGIYPEQVTVPATGAYDRPVLLQALATPGRPVVVDGADELRDPAQWKPVGGGVWVTASVTWEPH